LTSRRLRSCYSSEYRTPELVHPVEMSEADLIVHARPAHLPAVAIGDPEIGPEVAKEVLHHFLGARGRGDEKSAVVMVEDP